MLKPIYGLTDVPRAWCKTFHQVLIQWVPCQPFFSEPELYCVHNGNQRDEKRTVDRAKEYDLEQQE